MKNQLYSISVYFNRLVSLVAFIVIFISGLVMFGAPLSFSQSDSPVVINEIGWMGTLGHYSNEWLEIYNSSDQRIYLNEWVLRSADGSPDIVLKGYIEKDGYCLLERSSDDTIPDVKADYIYTGALNNTGERLELVNDRGEEVDVVDAVGTNWFGKGDNASKKSMERVDSLTSGSDPQNWRTSETSPGTPISNGCVATSSSAPTEVSPAISFSIPGGATAGQEFSVGVSLANFEPGTYALKVYVFDKDGKSTYGNTKGSAGWVSQNGAWKDMPQVQVSSSSVSTTIQAKVDDDAPAGSYQIAVSVAKKNSDGGYSTLWTIGELEKKSISVSSAPAVVAAPEGAPDVSDDEEAEINPITAFAEEGEVLGEEAPKKKDFKLNFYIILGFFGLLVGSGGLILAFQKRLRRWQKEDSQEPESANP